MGSSKWDVGGTHYQAIKAIAHENYQDASYAYDIALIKLEKPISYNERVQPIKYSARVVPSGEKLRVSGWGLLWEEGDWPEDLQTVNVTSVPLEDCTHVENVDTHESHLCALPAYGQGIETF